MNETRDPSSRLVQGWLKTDKGLGLIQGLKDKPWISKPVSQANLPPASNPLKIPPTPNVPNHPPILAQTFPDPPQALPLRRLSHTLVLGSLAEDCLVQNLTDKYLLSF